jgi:hypothetical protein
MASLKTTATAAKSPALKVLLKSPVLPAVLSASDVMVGAAVSMLMVALLALLPVFILLSSRKDLPTLLESIIDVTFQLPYLTTPVAVFACLVPVKPSQRILSRVFSGINCELESSVKVILRIVRYFKIYAQSHKNLPYIKE